MDTMGNAGDPAFLWFIAPAGAAGARRHGVRDQSPPLTPSLFGLSGAATVVGGILVGVCAVAYLRLLTS